MIIAVDWDLKHQTKPKNIILKSVYPDQLASKEISKSGCILFPMLYVIRFVTTSITSTELSGKQSAFEMF